jgi:hypothetical protein
MNAITVLANHRLRHDPLRRIFLVAHRLHIRGHARGTALGDLGLLGNGTSRCDRSIRGVVRASLLRATHVPSSKDSG